MGMMLCLYYLIVNGLWPLALVGLAAYVAIEAR
jgi:hypothetical protein